MPNVFKYTTGAAPASTLKKGNFYIGNNVADYGTTFYTGISPASGGYTIYLNKASGGPSIYVAANDSQLISFTNHIAGTNYTTINQCFNYFAGQSDKMVVQRDYEGIVTDGLVLNLDAGYLPSYPQNGTSWYDLGLSGKTGTLTNGPTLNNENGGSIVFDGVDDYTAFSNNSLGYSAGTTGELSLEVWCNLTGPFSTYPPENLTALGGIFGQGFLNGTIGWGLTISRVGSGPYQSGFQVRNIGTVVGVDAPFTLGVWNHVVGSFTRNDFSRIYINGVLSGSTSSTPLNGMTITPNFNDAAIGYGNSNNPFRVGGRVAIVRLYSKPLSASEVLQNYNAQKSRFGL